MNKKLIPLLIASTALIAGCKNDQSPSAPVVDKKDAIAEVNGVYISKASLESLKTELAPRLRGQTLPDEQLIDELVNRELLVQDAMKKNLENSPEIVARLDNMKRTLLAQADLQEYLKANPVTEEELKAEYDKKMGGDNAVEYKARHILVKKQDEAKKVIEKLNKGANFEELAKTDSTGPSASKGGDLGWFTSDRMVAPFSEAVIALENGKYTTEPVETQFGWHVILREDSRSKTPPPFEAVKAQFRPMMEREKVQSYLEQLRKEANVKILTAEAEEVVVEKVEVVAEPAAEQKAPAAEEKPAAEAKPATAEESKPQETEKKQ